MLNYYLKKWRILKPKIELNVSNSEYSFGSSIQGNLEIKGGLLKNILTRYEIDLVRECRVTLKEELLDSRSVYCKRECNPNQMESLPFTIVVPENEKQTDLFSYSLIARAVLDNSETILNKQPIVIK
jgi:hypothetical protein